MSTSEHARAFAVNSYSYIYSHRAQDCIDHLARHGHAHFELMLFPGHLWPAELDAAARRDLRRHLADRDLRLITLNIPAIDINIAAASKEMREYSLRILSEGVKLAGDLGVPGILICPGKHNPLFPMPKARMMDYFFAALEQLVPLAKSCGTQMLVENIPLAFLPDAESLMAALDQYGDPSIGVVYDVANAVFYREDPLAGLRRVRERLKLVHLSDTVLDKYIHGPVGCGVVQFAAIPPVLREIGYTELPMLEIITHDPEADIPASVDKLCAMGWPAV